MVCGFRYQRVMEENQKRYNITIIALCKGLMADVVDPPEVIHFCPWDFRCGPV